jgi:tripartite-type tricarboxylate transporter receptor subunit TctC
MMKRMFLACLVISLTLFSSLPSAPAADKFPSREIQIVTSSAPGGFVDITLRLMTPSLPNSIGVPVVVSNRPGAAGAAGTSYLVNAKPNGYTIGCISSKDTVITPATIPNLPFSYTDLDPLVRFASDYTIIFCKSDAPWRSLEDLVADAKQRPGKITYGATTNSVSHFLMEGFFRQAGISLMHVPLKNAGETTVRILGGNLDIGVSSMTPTASQLKAGNLRALFLAASERAPLFPQIPTLKEKGYREPVISLYTGFYAPLGLPRSIRSYLVAALEKAIKEPSLKKKVDGVGAVVDYSSGDALRKELAMDHDLVVKIFKTMKSQH